MSEYHIHDLESAPEASRPLLEKTQKAYGRIPNLMGLFAESPAILEAYLTLGGIIDKATAFSPTERQIIFLTTNDENGCDYCMAAHSAIASMQKVPEDIIKALRLGSPISDERFEALRSFTKLVVQNRGWVSEADQQAFFAAGYERRHLLEVVLGVGMKTLSNYANHMAQTPLDHQFEKFAWTRPETTTN